MFEAAPDEVRQVLPLSSIEPPFDVGLRFIVGLLVVLVVRRVKDGLRVVVVVVLLVVRTGRP